MMKLSMEFRNRAVYISRNGEQLPKVHLGEYSALKSGFYTAIEIERRRDSAAKREAAQILESSSEVVRPTVGEIEEYRQKWRGTNSDDKKIMEGLLIEKNLNLFYKIAQECMPRTPADKYTKYVCIQYADESLVKPMYEQISPLFPPEIHEMAAVTIQTGLSRRHGTTFAQGLELLLAPEVDVSIKL